MVALVVATRDSSGMGIAAPVTEASTNLRKLGPLALVLAAPGPHVLWPRPAQTVAFRKLSSRALRPPPRHPASPSGSGVADGKVGDHAASTVLEPHRGLHVVVVRAAATA